METIPTELIKRYSTAVPRYTSYPTAVEFKDDFSALDWRELLALEFSRERALSLYFHIPFCRKLCYFCACNKVITEDRGLATPYIKALESELNSISAFASAQPIQQIHWGGGSPNFLSPAEMAELHWQTLRYFPNLKPDAEVSVELDPRTTTSEQLQTLRAIGFNRISFGVQDFDKEVQVTINRVQSFDETLALAESGREFGFEGINLDLIYGLPQQTLEGFSATLKQVLAIRPDRIALYGYAHVTWLQKVQNSFKKFHLPTPGERIALFQIAVKELMDGGYEHIGLDHFALPDDSLSIAAKDGSLNRNFMGYTTHRGATLLGFGASSISTLSSGFAQNEKDPQKYQDKVATGELAVVKGLKRTEDDIWRGELIERILCAGRIDFEMFEKEYGLDPRIQMPDAITALSDLISDNLVSYDGKTLAVTPLGRFFARNIASIFDAYLSEHRKRAERVFSQAL